MVPAGALTGNYWQIGQGTVAGDKNLNIVGDGYGRPSPSCGNTTMASSRVGFSPEHGCTHVKKENQSFTSLEERSWHVHAVSGYNEFTSPYLLMASVIWGDKERPCRQDPSCRSWRIFLNSAFLPREYTMHRDVNFRALGPALGPFTNKK